jgi:two-component system KDP operon response regulator KdpE
MQLQFDPTGPFTLDPVTDTVVDTAGRVMPLTRTEFRLLHLLVTHAGRVLTHQELLRVVRGYVNDYGARKLLAVRIYGLRQKIEPDARRPRHIITVRNRGYTFRH